ncbi:Hypothetical protein, putative [Bodo saltans]|uniref:Uncharacterized protein n=1 Tax=Bodo saltans TaxID=75058 RepID=A0A0S4JFU2_BODSA|nr:Hypothetical protein, putative [Bodo saltans]|eukprot:CUG89050.1 Hypothetical protein, putative [Bodo saltans]
MDLRSVAHVVPLVLTKGTMVQANQQSVLGALQSWQQQLQNAAASILARPVMEETVVRTALALVWPRKMGEPLASLVRGSGGDSDSMRNGSFRGGGSSTSSIPSPMSQSQHSTSSPLRAVGGSANVAAARTSLIEATEKLESALPINSQERGKRVSDRCYVMDFLTRKQALKFFEAVHAILEQHELPLSLPPEPRYVRQRSPDHTQPGAFGTGMFVDDLPPSSSGKRRRRLMSVMGNSPNSGVGASISDGEALSPVDNDSGDEHESASNGSSRNLSDGDEGGGSDDGKRINKAATETSTHLRDMFERDDEDFDEEREAELDRRRRMRDEPLSDKTTLEAMPEDNLKKMSTAVAQEMIERLTAMKVVLKSPFHLTDAFVENSAAQQEERRILRVNAASMINTQFPSLFGGDGGDGSGGGDGEQQQQQPEPSSLEILTFQRLERSKNPVPVLEALRARKPEHFTREGAADFFLMCRDLYRKEREVLSHRVMSLGMLRREGLDSMRYFTGPALKGLFQSWALQRKREGYQLQQYLVELTQYLWFLKRCEAAETAGAVANTVYSADMGGSSHKGPSIDAAPTAAASTTAADQSGDYEPTSAADDEHEGRSPSAFDQSQQETANPLALYTTSASMREQLEHCRLLHVEMEMLLAKRKARYDAAGVVDPLFDSSDGDVGDVGGRGHHYGGSGGSSIGGHHRRSRSNVFPDQVAERLGAASIVAASTAATAATSSARE